MRIRASALISVIALSVALPWSIAAPAGAAASRRILVVLVDATLDGFTRTPALRALLDESAVGLLEQIPRDSARAIAVLGAGAPDSEDSAALARALSLEGVPFVARAEAGRALGAGNIHVAMEDAVPGDFATPSLAVLDGADLIPAARALLQRDDVLIALGLPRGASTGVIVAYGPGYTGVLSARDRGIVTLSDVAPSILATLQIAAPPAMTGRAFRAEPDDDPLRALRQAGRSRSPLPALALIGVGLAGAYLVRRRRRQRSPGA